MKKILDEFVGNPIQTSILVIDFLVLMFHKPPAFVSLLMLGLLVGLSMFFGQRLNLFDGGILSMKSFGGKEKSSGAS